MRRGLAVLCACALGLVAGAALAAPGDLDPTFGAGGKVVTPIGGGADSANAVGLEPDGSIVVAGSSGGDFAVVRYSPKGELIWKVTTPMGPGEDVANGLAIQPDGKIVVVGSVAAAIDSGGTKLKVGLARFNANGALDTTFGNGGRTITSLSSGNDTATAVARQSDGKLVVVGSAPGQGGDRDFAVTRFNPDGIVDGSFGVAGTRITPVGDGDDEARAVALQADGKIVALGESVSAGKAVAAVARYDARGALDGAFGARGIARVEAAVDRALVVRGDGSIVLGGAAPSQIALARLTKDGTLDTGFGSGGIVTSELGSRSSIAALALQQDGRVVAAGTTSDGAQSDFAVVRYEANGALDTSFGAGGKVKAAIGAGADDATAVALQPDGRIVVAGQAAGPAGDADFAVARFLGGLPRISIGDVRMKENAGVAVFPVTLDTPPGSSRVSVAWATKNGTARARKDFVARRGTLRFTAGATTATIRVPLVNDRVQEPVEAFTVVLSAPSGASLADRVGVARIVDDDRARGR